MVPECNRQNTENCAIRACIIEQNFVGKLFAYIMAGNQIDLSLKHDNGFDPVSHCGVKSSISVGETTNSVGETNISVGESAKTEKNCCGDYPSRKMFKTEGRGCCNGNTFNSEMAWCCPDGTVQLFGFC